MLYGLTNLSIFSGLKSATRRPRKIMEPFSELQVNPTKIPLQLYSFWN